MLWRRGMIMLWGAVFLLPLFAWGADEAATAGSRIATLKQQIVNLEQERDAVLAELATRYQAATPAERVALEAEGTRLQIEYERAFLELVVEYHGLTGNEVERARAQAILDGLNGVRQINENEILQQEIPAPPNAGEGVHHEN